jgi:hypothetical protein
MTTLSIIGETIPVDSTWVNYFSSDILPCLNKVRFIGNTVTEPCYWGLLQKVSALKLHHLAFHSLTVSSACTKMMPVARCPLAINYKTEGELHVGGCAAACLIEQLRDDTRHEHVQRLTSVALYRCAPGI